MITEFTEESGLVQVWVKVIKGGEYPKESVPNISNLREVVYSILEGH